MQIKTTIRYHLTAGKNGVIQKNTNNKYWPDVEKRNLYTLLEGMYTGAITTENSMVFPENLK